MGRVRFEFDPDFRDNVYRASNKTGSSLRPLYDLVRKTTDKIARTAKLRIQNEWYNAEAVAQNIDNKAYGADKQEFLYYKALSFALRSAMNSTYPTMGYDGNEIYGRVTINRRGSTSLEYGGVDPVAEVGKGTGEHVSHPAYAFLRNALRGF